MIKDPSIWVLGDGWEVTFCTSKMAMNHLREWFWNRVGGAVSTCEWDVAFETYAVFQAKSVNSPSHQFSKLYWGDPVQLTQHFVLLIRQLSMFWQAFHDHPAHTVDDSAAKLHQCDIKELIELELFMTCFFLKYTPGSSNIADTWKMGAPDWVDVWILLKTVIFQQSLCEWNPEGTSNRWLVEAVSVSEANLQMLKQDCAAQASDSKCCGVGMVINLIVGVYIPIIRIHY